jgi:hypothetical protein
MKKTTCPSIFIYIAIIWFIIASYFQFILPAYLATYTESGNTLPYILRLSRGIAHFLGIFYLANIWVPLTLGLGCIIWLLALKKLGSNDKEFRM